MQEELREMLVSDHSLDLVLLTRVGGCFPFEQGSLIFLCLDQPFLLPKLNLQDPKSVCLPSPSLYCNKAQFN